mmetsp:Transcript_2196/g.4196  ORF Transcript_2196/g.4196 Transcript_2196/m.4196 type:complete len:408 (-) Transcript_2196:248-1471(-)
MRHARHGLIPRLFHVQLGRPGIAGGDHQLGRKVLPKSPLDGSERDGSQFPHHETDAATIVSGFVSIGRRGRSGSYGKWRRCHWRYRLGFEYAILPQKRVAGDAIESGQGVQSAGRGDRVSVEVSGGCHSARRRVDTRSLGFTGRDVGSGCRVGSFAAEALGCGSRSILRRVLHHDVFVIHPPSSEDLPPHRWDCTHEHPGERSVRSSVVASAGTESEVLRTISGRHREGEKYNPLFGRPSVESIGDSAVRGISHRQEILAIGSGARRNFRSFLRQSSLHHKLGVPGRRLGFGNGRSLQGLLEEDRRGTKFRRRSALLSAARKHLRRWTVRRSNELGGAFFARGVFAIESGIRLPHHVVSGFQRPHSVQRGNGLSLHGPRRFCRYQRKRDAFAFGIVGEQRRLVASLR